MNPARCTADVKIIRVPEVFVTDVCGNPDGEKGNLISQLSEMIPMAYGFKYAEYIQTSFSCSRM